MMNLKKILLVDDSQPFNFLSRIMLSRAVHDCEIEEVLNGRDALRKITAENYCPDVILLDINMPVMDGKEFLREYTRVKDCCRPKIFMLTSSIRDEDREETLGTGVVSGYFEKPLTRNHIEEMFELMDIDTNALKPDLWV
jgi:CheY-like chemotaxis protein